MGLVNLSLYKFFQQDIQIRVLSLIIKPKILSYFP